MKPDQASRGLYGSKSTLGLVNARLGSSREAYIYIYIYIYVCVLEAAEAAPKKSPTISVRHLSNVTHCGNTW